MKKRVLKAITLGALLAPLQGLAQDAASPASTVTAATTSAPISFLPHAYGKLDLRHYYDRKELDATTKTLKYDPMFQPRFVLGSKFFNDRLDSRLIFGVNNKYGTGHNSNTVTDAGTKFWNDFTAYKNTYVSIIPKLWVFLPKSTDEVRKPTKVEFGIDIPLTYPIQTAAGTITLEAESWSKVFLKSKQDPDDQVELLDSDDNFINKGDAGLSLTDAQTKQHNLVADEKTGNYKASPNGRILYQMFSFGASYKPSFVEGLETEILSIYETTYVPVMEYDRSKQSVSMRTRGGALDRPVYAQKFEPSLQFTTKYAFNPQYSITNEFNFMDRAEGQRKYSNMVSLVAKLF